MKLQQNRINGTSALAREVIVIDPTVQEKVEHKLQVAAYARVSSDSVDQLNSFAAQIKHYTEIFNSHEEWGIVDIYTDESITGTRADTRPDFQRMLKDCRKGKINRILTKSISRFSRNTKDCLETLRELSKLGITVYFEKENIDTAEMPSELIITLFSSGAQEESYSISGNMRWSYQHRMKSGNFITCKAPFGYRLVNGTLLIDERESEIVRYVFKSYLDGKSKNELAKELTAIGLPTRDGNSQWQCTTIDYLLKNERYMGDAILQKHFTTDTLPFEKKRNLGEKDKYHVKGCHQGIISAEVFQKVQRLNDSRATVNPSKPKRYPLSQKVKCSECGSTFRRVCINDKTYWTCRKHYTKGNEVCQTQQIPEMEIHKAFTVLYNKLKISYGRILVTMLEQLQSLKTNRNQSNAQVCEINKEMANLTEQNHVLSGLKSKGYIDSALFISKTNELSHKIAKLKADKNKLMDSDDDDDTIMETQSLIEILENAPNYIDEFEISLFESIVTQIIVISDDKIKFCLTNGLELTETIERTVRK